MSKNKVPGEAIRRLRHYKGLPQKLAAQKLNISQQAYSKMERSKAIKQANVVPILKALGCSHADFEKLNGYPPPPNKVSKAFIGKGLQHFSFNSTAFCNAAKAVR